MCIIEISKIDRIYCCLSFGGAPAVGLLLILLLLIIGLTTSAAWCCLYFV